MTTIIDLGKQWPYPAVTEARRAGRGDWFKISAERADELLNVLPPIYFKGGFFVSEPASHEVRKVPGSQTRFVHMPVYSAVCKVGESHYLREVAADRIGEAREELLKAVAEQLAEKKASEPLPQPCVILIDGKPI